MSKIISLADAKIKPPQTSDANILCDEAKAQEFTSCVIMGQHPDGSWVFTCTSGIDKVSLIGRLEFIKMQIFESMGAYE